MHLSSYQTAQKARSLEVDVSGSKPCPPGCACKKHTTHAGGGKKCEPGCTCWRHSPERRERLRQLAIEQAEREGHEKRSTQVAAVWENRTKEERDAIARKAIASGRKTRHSPERRRISAQRMRDRWEVMAQEQKDAHIQRLLTGREKTADSPGISCCETL